MFSFFYKQYTGVFEIASFYWRDYGGLYSLLGSPYLHLAVVLLIPTIGTWSMPDWWDISIAVLPGLISFTLAGFAMTVAFGGDDFKRFVSDQNGVRGPLLGLANTFSHFLVIQTFAILVALVCKAHPLSHLLVLTPRFGVFLSYHLNTRVGLVRFVWCLGFLTFLYSITSIFSVTFGVLRMARWFNRYAALPQSPVTSTCNYPSGRVSLNEERNL